MSDHGRSTAGAQLDGEHPHAASNHRRAPLVVTWEVTQACGLTCDHCRAEAQPGRHPDELSTEAGRALLDRIAAFGDPAPIVVFSGGDPLQRPDLCELIEHAVANGLRTGVTPAPTEALDVAVLDRFEDLGVHRVALSLDGASPATHDGFRGEEGSFEVIHRAAEHAADIGLPLQINTTVTGTTVGELPAIADLVEAFEAVMWEVFFLVPVGRGTTLEQLSPEATERTLRWLYRRQRSADFRLLTVEAPQYRRVAREETGDGAGEPTLGSTGDGNGIIFVSHTGAVYPSGFLPLEVGDVREQDLVRIYRRAPLLTRLRDPSQLRGKCGGCPHRSYCGGSRARAYASSGDPFAGDPLCPFPPTEGGGEGQAWN